MHTKERVKKSIASGFALGKSWENSLRFLNGSARM